MKEKIYSAFSGIALGLIILYFIISIWSAFDRTKYEKEAKIEQTQLNMSLGGYIMYDVILRKDWKNKKDIDSLYTIEEKQILHNIYYSKTH